MPAVERSNSRFSFVPAVASWGAVGVADGHCWAAETGGEWLPRASVKAVTYRAVTGAADDDAIAGGWRATTSMCRSSLPSPQCFRSTERYWWKPREQSEMRVDFRDRFRGRFCAIMRQRRISRLTFLGDSITRSMAHSQRVGVAKTVCLLAMVVRSDPVYRYRARSRYSSGCMHAARSRE